MMKRDNLMFILMILLLLLTACGSEEAEQAPNDPPPPTEEPNEVEELPSEGTILAFGDSLTEGFGVEENEAYPALLEGRLREDGYNYEVINGGNSGETSSGALSRMEWTQTLKPDIVIVEIGGNDGLRGIDPDLTKENISQIVSQFKENGAIVVLAGMQIIQNLGQEYTTQFANNYPEVATEHDVILIPFMLEGVAGLPELNQPDVIHPTAEGYQIVLDTIYPYILEAIEAERAE
jgi:acyl-CoA thioesterase-1